MLRRLSTLLCLVVAAAVAGCQSPRARDAAPNPAAKTPESLPPVPETFGAGWTLAGPPRTFIGGDLFNHIDGAAEVFLELGFARVQVARYVREDAQIGLEVYEMRAPAAARALFYRFRGQGEPFPGVSGRNIGSNAQIIAQKGRCYVQVSNFGARPGLGGDMATLANRVWAALPDDEDVPLLGVLPAEGRIPRSEQIVGGQYTLQALYTLGTGDVLQLAGEHLGVAADYEDGTGETYTRLIVPYGTPAAAAAAFHHAIENLDPYLEVLEQSDKHAVFRDYEGRFGMITLAGDKCDLRLRLAARP